MSRDRLTKTDSETPNPHLADKELVCYSCSAQFVWSASQQALFASRRFSEPKRCPVCAKRRNAGIRRAKRPARILQGGLPTLGKRR
jgi:hypothetical protein